MTQFLNDKVEHKYKCITSVFNLEHVYILSDVNRIYLIKINAKLIDFKQKISTNIPQYARLINAHFIYYSAKQRLVMILKLQKAKLKFLAIENVICTMQCSRKSAKIYIKSHSHIYF